MNIIYANGTIQYGYLNNYFEQFLEDKIDDEVIDDYRDLTKQEFKQLLAYLEQHKLYDSILADIVKWEHSTDSDVMSEDLQDICLDWFEENIKLEAA